MPDIQQLNHAIIEFYDKLSSWEHSVVKGKNLTLAQTHTIEVIGAHGPMRMKELADKLGITMGTLTVQVDKLVKAEVMVRRPHDSDRRSILVDLTETGFMLYREHDELHLNLSKEITSNLKDSELKTLLSCLQRMNQRF